MRIGKRYSGVTAAVGMPGSGKSYFLAEKGWRARKAGIPLYSNLGFDLEGSTPIESFEDFAAIRGPAVICWDELPLYFSARRWAEFPDGMLYKFTQIRKDSVQLYYSTIHEMMVDSTLRRLTFWWWDHRSLTGKTMLRSLYLPNEFVDRRRGKPLRRQLVRLRQEIAATYDTMGKVAAPSANMERFQAVSGERFARPSWAGEGEPDGVEAAGPAPAGAAEGAGSPAHAGVETGNGRHAG